MQLVHKKPTQGNQTCVGNPAIKLKSRHPIRIRNRWNWATAVSTIKTSRNCLSFGCFQVHCECFIADASDSGEIYEIKSQRRHTWHWEVRGDIELRQGKCGRSIG